jgi:hypothetical protein
MNPTRDWGVVYGMITHQPYPSDVSDAEWQFVVTYLCLLPPSAMSANWSRIVK